MPVIVCTVEPSDACPSGTKIVVPAKGIDIEAVIRTLPDDVISHRVCELDKIPQSREFRNAWTDLNPTDTVDVDMSKAVEIHKDKLRALRKPLLEALDVEVVKAMEEGNQELINDIKARKMALRDVTADPALTLAATPEELLAVLPEALKGNQD